MLWQFQFSLIISFLLNYSTCHWHNGYFRWSSDGFRNYSNWMDDIDGRVSIFKLGLPATHDSGTAYVSNATSLTRVDIIVTQCLRFDEQLMYGIRVFDIRIRHFNNQFRLHHNDVYLNVTFGDFLLEVNKFLNVFTSETILFRLKEEWPPFNCTRSLNETLSTYLSDEPRLLRPSDFNVTLEMARNKFIILSDNLEFHAYGLKYIECDAQDDYYLNNNWYLYHKWSLVKQHLLRVTSTSNDTDTNRCFINYLSGSGGAFPYFVASGHISRGTNSRRLPTGFPSLPIRLFYRDFPLCYCFLFVCSICFEGTNILTTDYLQANGEQFLRPPGIIMADFPGTGLISQVIETNAKLRKN